MAEESPERLLGVPGLAPDVPYAYTSVVPGGRVLVFTAGACPLDVAGTTVAAG